MGLESLKKKMNKRLKGYRSYVQGLNFESIFELQLKSENINYINLPPCGGRWTKVKGNMVFVGRTICFDFLLNYGQVCAGVDVKSLSEADRVQRSFFFNKKKVHQIKSMTDLALEKSGFVFYFKKFDKVVYFNYKIVWQTNKSLFPQDGLFLGSYDDFMISTIFVKNT